MANFKNACLGEMIDDVDCPCCKENKLRLVGFSLEKTTTPLLIQCQECYSDFETDNDLYGLINENNEDGASTESLKTVTIKGNVFVPDNMSASQLNDEFCTWLESKGCSWTGGIGEI